MSDVETGNKAPAESEACKKKRIGIWATIVVVAIIALGLGLGLGLPSSNFQKQKALNAANDVPEHYHDEGYDDDATLADVNVPDIFAAHHAGENTTVAAANGTTVEDHSAGIVNPSVSWTEDHSVPDHAEFAKSEDSLIAEMQAANADGTMTTNTTDALPAHYHDEEYDDDLLTVVDVPAVFAAHHANGTAKAVADDDAAIGYADDATDFDAAYPYADKAVADDDAAIGFADDATDFDAEYPYADKAVADDDAAIGYADKAVADEAGKP